MGAGSTSNSQFLGFSSQAPMTPEQQAFFEFESQQAAFAAFQQDFQNRQQNPPQFEMPQRQSQSSNSLTQTESQQKKPNETHGYKKGKSSEPIGDVTLRWTSDEETLLAECFVAVSEDPNVGRSQPKDTLCVDGYGESRRSRGDERTCGGGGGDASTEGQSTGVNRMLCYGYDTSQSGGRLSDPAQGMKTPLILSWERIPRLDSGVRVSTPCLFVKLIKMGRDTIQLANAVSTISQEYLLEFTSEYGIPECLHPELPGPEETIVEFSEGKVDMDLFNLISAPNPTKVKTGTRPRAAHEVPLLTVTASRVIEMEDAAVASESSGTPSTIEKSPLDFANEDPPQTITERGGTEDRVLDEVAYEIPPTGNASTTGVALETGLEEEVAAMGPQVNKRRRKRGNDGADANAPPKVLRKDHVALRPAQSTLGGKSLAAMGLDVGSTLVTPATQETPSDAKSVSDPDPLSYAKPQPRPERDVAQSSRKTAPEIPTENVATAEAQDMFSVESPGSGKSTSVPSMVGSPGGIYQPGWGVTNNCRLDTPDACQDVVDHIVPPGYFSELRHLPNADFLSQYNMNLARQVAMGSQLRLRFEQEVRLLKKAKAQVAIRDQRIQVKEEEIKKLDQKIKSLKAVETKVQGLRNQAKNLETLLEAGVDMKKAAKAKNVGLAKELESLSTQFTNLQVSNNQLSEQVSTLQTQVTGEERTAFEEFKKYEDDKVEQRCVEMDARLDKLSVDFDEELYPHMLTAIAGRRWVIGHGMRLAVMKCAESSEIRQAFADVVSAGLAKGLSECLKYGIEHGKAGRDLADIEAYDPEANSKLFKALQDLKDLKYLMMDQLERLKDAP
ncbi:hypothetical protein Tco_1018147 [Tanacetum coccineum]|uniref:Transposase (Putative), gypsy type n=1 Tax=Tanacetum coccineum TaxID=301880 RepID=A0ABQ5FW38_9ASTR